MAGVSIRPVSLCRLIATLRHFSEHAIPPGGLAPARYAQVFSLSRIGFIFPQTIQQSGAISCPFMSKFFMGHLHEKYLWCDLPGSHCLPHRLQRSHEDDVFASTSVWKFHIMR